MHAYQLPELPKSPRPRRRRYRKRHSNFHKQLAREIKIKLTVNIFLSIVAIATLIKLLPYQLQQQAKLREVRVEVKEIETRVNELRDNFNRNFDPHQTRKIMQEQSPFIDPNQRRIFLVKN